jgi:hypothetical protein
MSLPKQPPSHSSSPSKSALRSTSGTRAQKPAPVRPLLPSPHFEGDAALLGRSPAVGEEHDESEEAEEEEEDGPPETRGPDRSRFQPFFTLIENTLTHAHHHPTVHYIFADDDTDIVTEAACRSLVHDDPFITSTATTPPGRGHHQQQDQEESEPEPEPSRLPAPIPGVREHYLLLDVQPIRSAEGTTATTTSSYEVTRAHSLSAEWQVTNTSIASAPTIDAVDDGDGAEGAGALMLRIEGRSVLPSDDDDEAGNAKGGRGSAEKESLEDMVRRFETGLADIRRAIEVGGGILGQEQDE